MKNKDDFYNSNEKRVRECLSQLFKGNELNEQLEYMKDDGFYFKKNNRGNITRTKTPRKVSRICNKAHVQLDKGKND